MKNKILFLFFSALLLYSLAGAETHIGGWISGRLTQEGSPYICDLDGDRGFGIERGDTLIIEAGITVLFPASGGIGCWGVLIAEGTEDDSITFDKAGERNWGGITFMDTTWNEVEIQDVLFTYCQFRNWRRYTQFWPELNNLILVGSNDHKPVFRNCSFQGEGQVIHSYYGYEMYKCRFRIRIELDIIIETRSPDVSIISQCVFEMANGGGIVITGECSSITSISNCLFYLPNRGTAITVCDSCQITNNIFMGEGSMITVIEGDFNQDFAMPEIKNNLFFNRRENADLNLSEDLELDEFGVLDRVNVNGDSTDVFGNLFMDPELAMEGDFPESYFPTEDSPCIDAGDPTGDPDPDSTTADIGPFFFPQCNIFVEPESVEFNDVQMDYISEAELEISNVGLEPLDITWLRIMPDDAPFDLGDQDNHLELPPDSSHTLMIYFYPPDEGEYEAVLLIESNDRDEGELEIQLIGTALGVELSDEALPMEFAIMGIYPNPFNSSTEIGYSLPFEADVCISIYDVAGRLITELINKRQTPGNHSAIWFGMNQAGNPVSSGVYFYRFIAKNDNNVQYRNVSRMVLLK
ncbi:MAG: T9SS type A sorting domain-containing protein [Candidatus Hatepunaea meridiana]|nr:T9SS type A sorting domain-containing protein [Candidatus Hatepunaea meridiana]